MFGYLKTALSLQGSSGFPVLCIEFEFEKKKIDWKSRLNVWDFFSLGRIHSSRVEFTLRNTDQCRQKKLYFRVSNRKKSFVFSVVSSAFSVFRRWVLHQFLLFTVVRMTCVQILCLCFLLRLCSSLCKTHSLYVVVAKRLHRSYFASFPSFLFRVFHLPSLNQSIFLKFYKNQVA